MDGSGHLTHRHQIQQRATCKYNSSTWEQSVHQSTDPILSCTEGSRANNSIAKYDQLIPSLVVWFATSGQIRNVNVGNVALCPLLRELPAVIDKFASLHVQIKVKTNLFKTTSTYISIEEHYYGHVCKSQLRTNHVAAKFRGFQKKQALQVTGGSGPIWERPYGLHTSHVPAIVDLYVLW